MELPVNAVPCFHFMIDGELEVRQARSDPATGSRQKLPHWTGMHPTGSSGESRPSVRNLDGCQRV